ncbi:Hypothetical predicted protein, partial [Olea europaea subsp. europaea]|uniref:Uncharacterized protein n=1 Tax=Olea europaea subsp. europaea TaxID=158383 RepID=A0A8S0RFT9_OLEEU
MDLDELEPAFGSCLPPALVSLTPFSYSVSPSPRRLSSCFMQPNVPVKARRQLAWVSLQGRLVGAEEASSAKTVDKNGVLSPKEAVAWELFSPIQRVLLVAVVAVAATNSKKNKQILKLKKSVELRDQVLLSMQQKLDTLCEQVNHFKDQPDVLVPSNTMVGESVNYGCKLCERPKHQFLVDSVEKGLNEDEVFKYKIPLVKEAEPEERRMSDWSDCAPSVTSSVDIQLDTLAVEQELCNLRKDCEEKDATIKELSTFLQSSEVYSSKRISELEDIIRRKNMIINKLRKDMLILEQKVVSLTRLRRPSFFAPSSNTKQLPVMADNVLYDMDSTTSPSSSDSDTSSRNKVQSPAVRSAEISVYNSEKASTRAQKHEQAKIGTSIVRRTAQQHLRSGSTSPLKEKSLNQTPNTIPALKPKHASSVSGENRNRRRPLVRSNEVAAHKRWF